MPVKWQGQRKLAALYQRMQEACHAFADEQSEWLQMDIADAINPGPRGRQTHDGRPQDDPGRVHLRDIMRRAEHRFVSSPGAAIWFGIGYVPTLNRHVGTWIRARDGQQFFGDQPIWAMVEFGTRPHVISPRTEAAYPQLTIWDGENEDYRMAWRVNHPGIQPDEPLPTLVGGRDHAPSAVGKAPIRRTVYKWQQSALAEFKLFAYRFGATMKAPGVGR